MDVVVQHGDKLQGQKKRQVISTATIDKKRQKLLRLFLLHYTSETISYFISLINDPLRTKGNWEEFLNQHPSKTKVAGQIYNFITRAEKLAVELKELHGKGCRQRLRDRERHRSWAGRFVDIVIEYEEFIESALSDAAFGKSEAKDNVRQPRRDFSLAGEGQEDEDEDDAVEGILNKGVTPCEARQSCLGAVRHLETVAAAMVYLATGNDLEREQFDVRDVVAGAAFPHFFTEPHYPDHSRQIENDPEGLSTACVLVQSCLSKFLQLEELRQSLLVTNALFSSHDTMEDPLSRFAGIAPEGKIAISERGEVCFSIENLSEDALKTKAFQRLLRSLRQVKSFLAVKRSYLLDTEHSISHSSFSVRLVGGPLCNPNETQASSVLFDGITPPPLVPDDECSLSFPWRTKLGTLLHIHADDVLWGIPESRKRLQQIASVASVIIGRRDAFQNVVVEQKKFGVEEPNAGDFVISTAYTVSLIGNTPLVSDRSPLIQKNDSCVPRFVPRTPFINLPGCSFNSAQVVTELQSLMKRTQHLYLDFTSTERLGDNILRENKKVLRIVHTAFQMVKRLEKCGITNPALRLMPREPGGGYYLQIFAETGEEIQRFSFGKTGRVERWKFISHHWSAAFTNMSHALSAIQRSRTADSIQALCTGAGLAITNEFAQSLGGALTQARGWKYLLVHEAVEYFLDPHNRVVSDRNRPKVMGRTCYAIGKRGENASFVSQKRIP